MKLLTIKNLNISDKEGQAIIKNVDLNIYNQSLNVIIGESGAGKSLTVKAILNHLPTQLHMSFDEFKMQGQNTSGIKQLLGKHIGYISQNYAQSFNEYTRLDKQLIAIYRYHFNVSKDNALKKIKKALTWVNLNDVSIINNCSFQLSGGQVERVNIHHNTVLLITHNMNHVLKYADYFNVMRNGMMIESGEIDKLFNHHHLHRYTEQLLNYRSKLQKEDNI